MKIDKPQHGWVAVELSCEDQTYRFFPSRALYDSIWELVCALLAILQGSSEQIVHWCDEPQEHEFSFRRENGQLEFQVFPIAYSTVVGRRREDQVFYYRGSYYEVIRPLWKALRDMQSSQSLEEYEKEWRHPFPVSEMTELTARVKELNPLPPSNGKH